MSNIEDDKGPGMYLAYFSNAKEVLVKDLRLSADDFIILETLSKVDNLNNLELLKRLSLFEDPFIEEIETRFGNNALQIYKYISMLTLTWHYANLLSLVTNAKDKNTIITNIQDSFDSETVGVILGLHLSHEMMQANEFLFNSRQEIEEFGVIVGTKDLKNIKIKINEIVDILYRIICKNLPIHRDLYLNVNKIVTLSTRLLSCEVGKKGWREYENICLDILDLLFVPPFSKVFTQVTSIDNHERRDAVIPNNNYKGFWNSLRHEYDCKNIIIEFKNKSKKFTKDSLNQLRIYLSKPTIGRFGLLFVRKLNSDTILLARRYAFEQSRVLILIVDDDKLIDMMVYKSIYGSIDGFLEELKTEFELNY